MLRHYSYNDQAIVIALHSYQTIRPALRKSGRRFCVRVDVAMLGWV